MDDVPTVSVPSSLLLFLHITTNQRLSAKLISGARLTTR